MSTNLGWMPVPAEHWNPLSDGMKFSLRNLYEFPVEATLTTDDLPMLRGMVAAGSAEVKKDAKALIEAIEKHDAIIVKEIA